MNQPSKIVTQGQDGVEYVRQHLIDPELCLACGSCMAVCTEGAVVTNDHMYPYVIDPDKCTNGMNALRSVVPMPLSPGIWCRRINRIQWSSN